MKLESYEIPISKFLTNYLNVKLDYTNKKWTHTKIREILEESNLLDCICEREKIQMEDIYRGEILAVVDQYGSRKYYKNPLKLKNEYAVDSSYFDQELEEKTKQLQMLYKERINDCAEIMYHFLNIKKLDKEIEDLKSYIQILRQNEEVQIVERNRYTEKMKRKREEDNVKYKRKSRFKYN